MRKFILAFLLLTICRAQETPQDAAKIFARQSVFPDDSLWNTDISQLPVDPDSDRYLAAIGIDRPLHPDFGPGISGIPFQFVNDQTPREQVVFQFPDESDKGPYPIPENPLIEGGASAPLDQDRHMLLIDTDHWRLYELYQAIKQPQGWHAVSGAIWDLTRNATRPAGWTSADAAGLPVFPGLVRYDEVHEKREISHAVRFTLVHTRRAYAAPASHWASSSNDPSLLPMGARLRLRQDFDITPFAPDVQVILIALKKYGMILADNGSDFFISGAPDDRWNNDILHQLTRVHGKDLEVVKMGPFTQ